MDGLMHELIVETAPWSPRARNARRDPNDMVAVRIGYSETALRERVKTASGIWRPRQRLWGQEVVYANIWV